MWPSGVAITTAVCGSNGRLEFCNDIGRIGVKILVVDRDGGEVEDRKLNSSGCKLLGGAEGSRVVTGVSQTSGDSEDLHIWIQGRCIGAAKVTYRWLLFRFFGRLFVLWFRTLLFGENGAGRFDDTDTLAGYGADFLGLVEFRFFQSSALLHRDSIMMDGQRRPL